MTLAILLDEIAGAAAPLTPAELGNRLGVSTEDIDAMLAALRAHGLLVADRGGEPADVCERAGACLGSCPGPTNCALASDPGVVPLQLVGPRRRSAPVAQESRWR